MAETVTSQSGSPSEGARFGASGRFDCCSFAYTCPTTGERECLVHGGFEVCCDAPRCTGTDSATPTPQETRR